MPFPYPANETLATYELVDELIARIKYSNGLDFVSLEKIQELIALLPKN